MVFRAKELKMKKFTSKEIKEFVSKPLFDEKIILNKDTSWPKISIVTPSYNQGQFLERTILSVLNQNYPNLEYTIIDGGSTDRSVEIIKKYEKYLAYWVSEKDKGQSEAINKGFQKSTGGILAWLNSDDTYLPNALQSVVVFFEQHPHADMLYGRCHMMDRDDKIFQEAKTMPFNLSDYAYGLFTIPQQAAFWRREIFFKAGMLNAENSTCMDGELWVDFAKNKADIIHVNGFLAAFRLHRQSISGSGKYNDQYQRDKAKILYGILGYCPSFSRMLLQRVVLILKHPVYCMRYYLSLFRKGRVPIK
ncbi:glycosyltransferase [Thermodesulfovibrionales bacterium]|nr:glycosyltransferase [Thermodesulfovibrionales bacterium]